MKLLLAEDDASLRRALLALLGKASYSVDAVDNGEDALEYLRAGQYDGAILDIMMPKMDGLQVLTTLRQEENQVPVLMLTVRDDSPERIRTLELGADDCVRKPCPPRELVARINAILRRTTSARAVASPVVVGPVTISPAQRSVRSGEKPIELTGTEFSLFELLARNVGSPISKEEIYPKVLGRPMGPYDRAIDVHVSSIRHKLAAVIGKSLAIESIRGVGYQLVVRSDEPGAA